VRPRIWWNMWPISWNRVVWGGREVG
jgi:hypothetical protein